LTREFNALYTGERLPSLNLQYKDFAEWQNRLLQPGGMKKQETYWLKEFERPVPVLKLPLDFPRPTEQHFQGDTVEFELPAGQWDQLKVLARTEKVTMFTLLFTLYNVFLFKLSGQEDIVVGTVVAGRRHADLEKIIGMFVNTLALRNYPSHQMTFEDFLQAVTRRTLEALENQDYQFEDLVEKVLPTRDTGRNPLFDTVFTYTPFEPMAGPGPQPEGKELKSSSYDIESTDSRVKFDMVLAAVGREKTVHLSIDFKTKLYKKETIQRFSHYFKELISRVLENKKNKLKDIKIAYHLEFTNADIYESVESDFEFQS
jgi:non-ribosomal peptide synthetase component F